jgi:uncharacterized membrane protein YfcA
MEGPAFWLAAVIAAALIGMGKGGLPVVGMLSVPVLALVISPVAAAGLLLPVYVLSDMFGLYAYRHAFDRRVLSILVPASTLGVGLGWLTASVISEQVVEGLVGLIGATFAANLLLRRGEPPPARPASRISGTVWGAISGFTSFVSHAGGPPYQIFVLPLRLEKTVFAGTTTIAFAYMNAIKLVPYWALGQLSLANLKVAAVLTIPAVISVFLGVWMVRRLPTTLFFRLVVWALLLVSLKLLWDALSAGIA